jgi:hypothetical protein
MFFSLFFDSVKNIPKRIAKVFYDGSTDTLSTPTLQIEPNTSTTNELRFKELPANGSNYVGFKAPTSITNNLIWKLPDADGPAGNAIITDGNGNLSFGSSIPSFMTKLYFDVTSPSGQTNFDTGTVTTFKNVQVYENGIERREGSGYDYLLNNTEVIFNYTVKQNSWVAVYLGETLNTNTFDFTVVGSPRTTFTTLVDMTDKTVQVFHNGVLKREGVSDDYVISNKDVIFNYTIPVNAWVKIVVF